MIAKRARRLACVANLTRSNWTTDKAFPPAQSLSPLARGIANCPSTMPRDSKAQALTTARHSFESQLCSNQEVVVVGGGDSAGQAAVFLAQTSKRVHMLVRSDGLAASMSRYLIRRIEQNPAIDLRTCTEVVGLEEMNTSSACDSSMNEPAKSRRAIFGISSL